MTAVVETRAATTEAQRVRKPKRAYLYQVDLFRIITFASVIGVHVIGTTLDPNSTSANGVLVLLHFTRFAFFALTGFVLVYQYGRRSFATGDFWRRRFKLVGIPYVAWSVIYWGYSVAAGLHQESIADSVRRLLFEVATGGAWYQLYFLLVTMQAYLLFPLVLRLLRATAGQHRWVLATSGLLQLGMMWWLSHPPTLSGAAEGIWNHLYATFLPYQFFMLLGAMAAWHIDAVNEIVHRFGGWFVTGLLVVGVFSELYYLRATNTLPGWQASNVFWPYLMPWFLLVIAGLYTVGSWWAGQRREHSFAARAVSFGSDRSFGVFLVHPMMLQLMTPVIPGLQRMFGTGWGTAVLYSCVLAASVVATEILRRIPGSLWLTGRPRLHIGALRSNKKKAARRSQDDPAHRAMASALPTGVSEEESRTRTA